MKQVKRSLVSFVFAFILIAFPVGNNGTVFTVQAEMTVYVTPTGEKYYTHACGRGTYTESTLSAAKARGLTACKKCFPNGEPKDESSSVSKDKSLKSAKLKISKTSLRLTEGETMKLSAKGGSGKIKWSSSNKRIVTVSQKGKVKAKSAGTAVVRVKRGKTVKKCKVTVLKP